VVSESGIQIGIAQERNKWRQVVKCMFVGHLRPTDFLPMDYDDVDLERQKDLEIVAKA